MDFPVQHLNPRRTTWHITVGTYGARLHGGDRITVARPWNNVGDPFIHRDADWQSLESNRMRGSVVLLTLQQRTFIEQTFPALCMRGGWTFRTAAAPHEQDHWHLLLDADPLVHGKQIRMWVKRWLTQEMDAHWPRPQSGSWWVEGGSTKAVKDPDYLNHVFPYITNQRTLPL